MGRTAAAEINVQIRAIRQSHRSADQAIERLLSLARSADASDPDMAAKLLEAAEEVGLNGQARQGQLVQLLAQADRVKAHRAGLAPWISTHLDSTEGAARGLARTAREIGHVAELSEPLSSGRLGTATIRALTRTARAVKGTGADLTQALTTTLETATGKGVGEAVRQVRILEETRTPERGENRLAEQRRRSFLRLQQGECGMTRIEAQLDPERAAAFRAVLDRTVSACLRALRHGHTGPVPEHMRSLEQLQAHALMRIAEAFAEQNPTGRAAPASPFLHPGPFDAAADARLAENLYGLLLPASIPPPAVPLISPVPGESARLAALAQRAAAGWRSPAGDRPASPFPLQAKGRIPQRRNGAATVDDLARLCLEDRTLMRYLDH